ncbi:hypothetical protein B0H14DRAFT_3001247 [Mycena olivaceomarginata]|nr:hypothetical protein B0H14DRAFT_3001247 [Mycena olivaceomarginata]
MTTTTSLPVTVEVHCVDCLQQCSAWPAISTVYATSDVSLPSWCATGPYEFVSDRILHLLPELPTTDFNDAHQERLADVFNLTLCTVADVRSLIQHYGPTRSVLPFVFGLWRVLACMCTKECAILTETPFVLPRPKTTGRGLDGVATMLACHIVEGPRNERQHSRGDLVEDRSECSPPIASPTPTEDSRSDRSTSSDLSIDVPLDAHVLPGRGRHFCVVLPFLCFGDQDNIRNLMASVACQRYVWGIPEPVVGFALSETGVAAKLVLSWVDPTTNVVHIVCPVHTPDSKQSKPLGMFDFRDAASALSFSQLILALSPQFTAISERAKALCESKEFDWRVDNTKGIQEFTSWEGRVAQWVDEVEMSLSDSKK